MISPSAIDPLQLPSVALTDRKQLPQIPCIYFAIDPDNVVQYIGRSVNPRQRWQNHHRQAQLIGCRIAYMPCDAALLDEVETALIEWFSPPLNGAQAPTKIPRAAVYLSPELKAQLEVLADKQNRSVSNLLETLAREAIEEAKKSGVLP
jgi:hypothetical protein